MVAKIKAKPVVQLSDAVRADFFDILEPTLHIRSQEQFLIWTQTDLQRLFPHGRLVCGVGRLAKSGVQIRHVIAHNFPDEYIRTLNSAGGLVSSPILVKWLKERQPILFEPGSKTGSSEYPAEWLSNFRKFGLGNLAAHGVCDADSYAASYFSFSSIPGPLTQRHAYLLKLLVPHLHVALTRVFSSPQFKKQHPPQQQANLTHREKEILQWLSTGKSNWEIAQVVGLSEATVKNHIYHLMGKLQVSTRAQAVAKAINTKLINAKFVLYLCVAAELLSQARSVLLDPLTSVV